ncbi:MAG: outer membrane protein transport protein [Pseudomonadota bacterium]|nr:outer membrane protein transport protein [Pseudomonadota bacterium]
MIYRIIMPSASCPVASITQYLAALILVCAAQSVYASFTDNLTIGNPKALSLGHAVTADPPSIDSVHYNPAGLTRLKGRQLHLKFVYGMFSTEYELGDYGEFQQGLIDEYSQYWSDEDGNLTPEGEAYFYDEALNTKSEVEGPTVMLPGGMVDLPFAGGFMGGASYTPPGSRYTFATNVYAPMMNGVHRDDDDPGRFFQQRGAFTLLTYFSPSVAFEVSDEFQIGLSINFNYSGMGIDLPAREPHLALFFYGSDFISENFCNPEGPLEGVTDIDLCNTVSPYTVYTDLRFEVDQNLVLGYNVGMLWSPEPWITFGLSYNSNINVDMDGDYEFPIRPYFKDVLLSAMGGNDWPLVVAAAGALGYDLPTAEETANQGSGKINVTYEIPQHWNFGMSLQITPKWKYNVDVRWTEWSAFSKLNFKFDRDIPLMQLGELADQLGTGGANGVYADGVEYQLNLQDVTYWGMGTEYQYNKNLALRMGFEKRPSAVPDDEPNAFIPINDGNLYSVGFGYRFDDDDNLDVAIGYFASETHYPPCSAKLGNGCNPNDVVFAPYQGQDIKSKVEFILFEIMYSKHF